MLVREAKHVLACGGRQSPAPPDEWKLYEPSREKRAEYANYGNYDLLWIGWHLRMVQMSFEY